MIVISAFDGIACGRVALERAGLSPDIYYAFEVDSHAIKVAQKNFPDIVQLGDIRRADEALPDPLPPCDLLLGGSPCQGFSFAGDRLNFDDPRSKLFFDFVALKERVNPLYFLFENVPMNKRSEEVITARLGVEPIRINSARVSAQNRERLYWTNIPGVTQPEDRGILLRDILETSVPDKYLHTEKAVAYMDRTVKGGRSHWDFKHHSDSANAKSAAVVANFFKGVPYNVLIDRRDKKGVRKLTPLECERLQTLPDNYTAGISNTQRYKAIGNGWTVEVIAHILRHIPADTLSSWPRLVDQTKETKPQT